MRRLDYAQQQALAFIGSCFIVGAVLGFISALVRPVKGERHG